MYTSAEAPTGSRGNVLVAAFYYRYSVVARAIPKKATKETL